MGLCYSGREGNDMGEIGAHVSRDNSYQVFEVRLLPPRRWRFCWVVVRFREVVFLPYVPLLCVLLCQLC